MSRVSEVCFCDSSVALAWQLTGVVSGPWAWMCCCEASVGDPHLVEVKPWSQVSLVL